MTDTTNPPNPIQDDEMLDLENNQNFCVYRLALDPDVPYGARVMMVSPSIRQLAGVQDPYNFAGWFERVHPDDEQRILEGNRRALVERKPYDEVVRVWHPQKQRWVWLHTVSTPIFGPDGVPTHYNGLVVDISEQKRAEQRLQYKIQFEDLITAISTQFINLPSKQIDQGIQRALRSIGEFAGVDRSYVFLFSPDHTRMDNTHEWCAAGIQPQAGRLQNLPVTAFDWFSRRLLAGETLHIPRLSDLPPEAEPEKGELTAQNTRSLIVVPMSYQGQVIGFLGFDSVHAQSSWDEEVIRLLTMVGEIFVNALEHKRAQQVIDQAYQLLEQRVEERTRELSTLLEVSHNLTSILDLEPLLGLILSQLRAVVDYTGAAILTVNGRLATVQAYRGPVDRETMLQKSFPEDDPLYIRVVGSREAVIIADMAADAPPGPGPSAHPPRLPDLFGSSHAWMGVPLIIQERVVGLLVVDHVRPGYYTRDHGRLTMAFANQAAVAIENARLYHEEQRRRRETERRRQVAEGLRSLLEVLNSDRPIGEILNYAVAQAAQLISSNASMLRHADPSQGIVTTEASFNTPADFEIIRVTRLYYSSNDYRLMAHQPIVISDLQAEFAPLLEPGSGLDDIQRANVEAELKYYRSSLAVPVFIREEIYGALRFYFEQPVEFSDEDIRLAMTIGDQVALAIENARLRAHLQENAAAAERNRLARDLHDAVTQTLFSASLIAEVLPKLLERKPEEGRRRLEELRQLTRGALAEMRTLLLELRPAALTGAPLDDLLRQLVEAFTGRTRLPVDLNMHSLCSPPSEVRVVFYRIAQEALNNIAKHSKAHRVRITLSCEPGSARLLIADDGQGFDPDRVSSEHLGLSIMRERAAGIGAGLEIASRPGQGAQVRLYWQEQQTGKQEQEGEEQQ